MTGRLQDLGRRADTQGMQPHQDHQPQVVVVPLASRDRGGAEMAMLAILFVMLLANIGLTVYLVWFVRGLS